MKTLIFASGKISNYSLVASYCEEANFVLCADGGIRHCRKLGIKPDLIMGDLDSTEIPDLEFFREIGVPIEKFPAEKDQTDLEICIERALEKGGDILILGATGGRADHYIANIFLLSKYASYHGEILLADEENEIRLLSDEGRSALSMNGRKGDYVSLVPVTNEVTGVTISGAKYVLKEHLLRKGSTFSVSNEFAEDRVSVQIEKGELLVIKSRE